MKLVILRSKDLHGQNIVNQFGEKLEVLEIGKFPQISNKDGFLCSNGKQNVIIAQSNDHLVYSLRKE